MKIAFAIILAITLYSCSPEKNIEVKGEVWTLVDKKKATRYFEDGFIWLIWENKYHLKYMERMSEQKATQYQIGMIVYNRIR